MIDFYNFKHLKRLYNNKFKTEYFYNFDEMIDEYDSIQYDIDLTNINIIKLNIECIENVLCLFESKTF